MHEHRLFCEQLALNCYSFATPQKRLAQQLFLIFGDLGKSEIFKVLFEYFINEVCDAIDDGTVWRESFRNDYIEHGSQLVMHGDAKRRRMDAGLQRFLGSSVVSERRACTTNAYLRAHPSLYANRHGLRMNEKVVCSTISAGWLTFFKSIHVNVVSDGVRSGAPATEDLLALAYDCEHDFSTWLPPMDPSQNAFNYCL